MPTTRVTTLLLAMLCACASATPTPETTPPTTPPTPVTPLEPAEPVDALEGTPLVGPFASWEEICGQLTNSEHEVYERCRVRGEAELDQGPFEKIASFHEGDPGSSFLALKTSRGWFVQEVPDGRPFGGGRSHHTPAGISFDPHSSFFRDGLLHVVERGGSSSFLPGRGAFGSSNRRWTNVIKCQLTDEALVCAQSENVWSETCRASDMPTGGVGPGTPGPTRTCEETGSDIARP